jgi:cell division transport system permease protein
VPEELHSELEKLVQALDSRWKITYVSRREAAQAFTREFDPDLFDVLKDNPLPASFRISLPPEEMSPDSARRAAELLLTIEGIDDVIYDREIIDLLHAGNRKLTGWGLFIGALAVFLAVGLTFNAVRLKIMAERETMNLMSLLGAVPGTLRAIYWVQGAILGAIGGLLSAGLILLLAAVIQFRLINGVDISVPHLYLLVVGGCLLGMVAGGLAVGKYLKV